MERSAGRSFQLNSLETRARDGRAGYQEPCKRIHPTIIPPPGAGSAVAEFAFEPLSNLTKKSPRAERSGARGEACST